MNKKIPALISSLLTLSTLALSSAAFAQDITYKFICPWSISNLGSYVSGVGSERLDKKQAQKIEFTGKVAPGIPTNLSSYGSSYVKYDATKGVVTCQYTSNIGSPTLYASYDSIVINGTVTKETNNQVNIKVPVGIRE